MLIRRGSTGRARYVDLSLTALLLLQGFTLFVAIPLGAASSAGLLLLDICHLSFAIVCVVVLTRHRIMQAVLLVTLALLVSLPMVGVVLPASAQMNAGMQHEVIALVAFAFNAAVTALVARHVFTPGVVTVHRVRGAVLLYLNVAALFAIAYGFIAMKVDHAFEFGAPTVGTNRPGAVTALFTYFSLTTITTTGYGDVVPLHPLARSLANLEAVFGQLFPATLLARLVALHLAHGPRSTTLPPRREGLQINSG